MLILVGGMPRAGSTLLQAILDQNPKFHAWITSGLLETLIGVRNSWDKYVEHQACDEVVSEQKKRQVLQGIIDGYYGEIGESYIFDKSRGWLAHLEMIEWVLGRKVKVLVPVRDLREILASFELLWRNTAKQRQVLQEMGDNYLRMQTVIGRCQTWMADGQPVGLAYNRLADAIQRGYRDRLYFVPYEDLCNDPQSTMNGIYNFLELEPFKHDFNNVVKIYPEDDRVHTFLSLHQIKPKVTPVILKATGVLGEVADLYKPPYIWQK